MTNKIDLFDADLRQITLPNELPQITLEQLQANYEYSLFVNASLETQKQIFGLFKVNLI